MHATARAGRLHPVVSQAPALPFEDVVLRDGSTLRLRPPASTDDEALATFFERLSPETRYLRFHGARAVVPSLTAPFLDPDWTERGALVGTLADESGEQRIVALASYVRLRGPARAEVAFVVADELQRRGIGTRLLERLAAHAGAAGIERFVATVLPQNRQMLRVFEAVGFAVTRELDEGVIEVEFPIVPTATFLEQLDLRDHTAVCASLQPFFTPRSVAVIGASPRRGTIGGELFRNMLRADFDGVAYPVNRDGKPVAGVRGYTNVTEIDDEVDLAVICVPGELVLDAAEASLCRGIRALCVISAGFAELGGEGIERQRRLLELVREHGGRLIGPNCLGIAVADRRLNATFARNPVPFGSIGFSSQSGALGLALIEAAGERGLGLSAFVSIGNKADVSSNDLLEWWEEDDATRLILLYLESFGNPRKFARLARRIARSKPILAMKSGRTASGVRAASSHTAALAGSERAVDALFHQAGVLRAETLEELLDVAALLSRQPLPRGRRVALLTNAGGLGILCADACDAAGLTLPALSEQTVAGLRAFMPEAASHANPVDMLGSATSADYERAIPLLLADPRVDSLIVLFVPPVSAGANEVADAIERAAAGAEKPVLASLVAAEAVEPRDAFVDFRYPESAARALGRAAERADWLERPSGAVPELDGVDRGAGLDTIAAALARGDSVWLEQDEITKLFEAYGLPLVPQRRVDSIDGAVAAARELGFPAVVKSAAAGAHKTETGGVALDLRDEDAVREAATRIGCPLLVQPMLRGGVELLAGLVQDPVFGPLVAFGPGGVFAELIGEASFRLAPLTDVDAEELVTTGKAGRLVAGYRGAPGGNAAALADLLHRLSRLAEDLPEVAELDLNPVMAEPDGCVVVDARVRVAAATGTQAPKTW
jgi:acetyl coenzyme A synthetase (ADP forming)-like protein